MFHFNFLILLKFCEKKSFLKCQKRVKYNLTMCVQPSFYFAHANMLIRYLELWILAGIEKFYFYYQSVSDDIWQILEVRILL